MASINAKVHARAQIFRAEIFRDAASEQWHLISHNNAGLANIRQSDFRPKVNVMWISFREFPESRKSKAAGTFLSSRTYLARCQEKKICFYWVPKKCASWSVYKFAMENIEVSMDLYFFHLIFNTLLTTIFYFLRIAGDIFCRVKFRQVVAPSLWRQCCVKIVSNR